MSAALPSSPASPLPGVPAKIVMPPAHLRVPGQVPGAASAPTLPLKTFFDAVPAPTLATRRAVDCARANMQAAIRAVNAAKQSAAELQKMITAEPTAAAISEHEGMGAEIVSKFLKLSIPLVDAFTVPAA